MNKHHQNSSISRLLPQPFRQFMQPYALLVLFTLSTLLLTTARAGWMQAAAATGGSGAAARIAVTPHGNLYASTWNDNSFVLTNTSTGGQRITAVAIDLRSALLPNLVFDPNGTTGDQYAKGLTPNHGAAAVGYSGNQLSGFAHMANELERPVRT